MIHKMNEDNATQERILELSKKQAQMYANTLEYVMSNKNSFINETEHYEKEIYTLKKIIKINKRSGNEYAVLKDEVLLKSYQLIQAQNTMIKNIFIALDSRSIEEFEKKMGDLFVSNQLENQKINNVDYEPILLLKDNSKTLQEAKNNIRDFYALMEVNADVLKYLTMYEKKMYRLNKYAKYNLVDVVLKVNNSDFAKKVNSFLSGSELSIVKIALIFLVFLLIYFIRKVAYKSIEKYLLKVKSLQKYTKDILRVMHRPIEIIFILINIQMTVYIYNDFSGVGDFNKFFNMFYGFLFAFILYRILNTVAGIKIHEIDQHNKKIKNEIINVGIKILNFLIMILGLLLILHFAGANLTAVLSGLGIGGFAVALAAKDSLANFFGTLSILISDTFSQGDWIVVDGQEGTVVEIGLRVTTLRTFDNALIAIPNATLANKDVKNWNKRLLGRRIKMNIGVKYSSKPADLKNAVTQIRGMLENHPDIATSNTEFEHDIGRNVKLVSLDDASGIKKTLLVYLDEFAGSNIGILVYCFSKTVNWNEWLIVKEDVMYKIMEILEKNSLEFAFPSMSLYHENDATLKVSDPLYQH
ncbi:mechanosensitive ion channel family protein [bacterium]|nr:mechanosensitive ion channel family protein [bacterium]MBU1995061.1 mechanosensitive ion channel family protein [bacterium]